MGPIKYSFSFETYCRYYIIKDVQPLSCVEKAGFQQLIGILAPGLKVRGRTFYTNMLKDRYAEKKCALTKALQSATDVGTTADCWTSRRKSYLGQTVHWFDNNLQRNSGCFGISRLIGSHTYDVLAKAMEPIHVQYQIGDKLGVTTTDNKANLLKVFREFGRKPEVENSDEDEIGKNWTTKKTTSTKRWSTYRWKTYSNNLIFQAIHNKKRRVKINKNFFQFLWALSCLHTEDTPVTS